MADKKISELTALTGANVATDDQLVIVDTSAALTKNITIDEFKNALDTATGFVRITGDTMTGDLALSGADVTFGDNDKAIFGAGSDLQIYHGGNHSFISEQGTGNLKILADSLVIKNAADTQNYITGTSGGAAALYHAGSEKLATTSTGIDVTGTVTADDILLNTGGNFRSSIDTSNVALSGGTNSNVGANIVAYGSTHPSAANDLIIRRSGTKFALFDGATGDISFYEDTGTTAKFFWDASAESLGIGASSPSSFSGSRLVVKPSGGEAGTNDVQSWEYTSFSSGSEYDLRLQQVVSSGLVKHQFNVRNGGTDYTSNLVLDRGNVGIGTSSPSAPLQVQGSAGEIRLQRPTASQADWSFKLPSSGGELTFYDNNNSSEAMRIDSSGNLLVGKTTTPIADDGIQLSSGDYMSVTRTGAELMYLNRKGSGGTENGDIIKFYSNTAQVGSIGVIGGTPYIVKTTGGVQIGNGGLNPVNSSGGLTDGVYQLGASNARFTNLYLSGGVYLGGTGAANKLDDYEEGTWTPVLTTNGTNFSSVTYDGRTGGTYTKVGRVVQIQMTLVTDAVTVGSASGALRISGLPFSPSTGTEGGTDQGMAALAISGQANWASNSPDAASVIEATTQIALYYKSSASAASYSTNTPSDVQTGTNDNYVQITGTYITDA